MPALRRSIPAVLAAVAFWAAAAGAAEVRSLSPSDRLTVKDPAQLTGRRVALALPDCAAAPSTCEEIRLLNQLDGFSVNPRVAITLSAPIQLESVTRANAFILPVWSEPLASPIGLAQLVWDPEGHRLYARPERTLLQGRRYAIVVTTRVLDEAGRPLRPGPAARLAGESRVVQAQLASQLQALKIRPRDVAALSVFTTQSVTAGLEQIRAIVESRPAPVVRFGIAPGGQRSVFAREEIDGIELRRQVATARPLGDPVKLPLALIPPAEVRSIGFGRFSSQSFLSPEGHIPATPTRTAPGAITEQDVHVTVFLPAGTMPAEGWPVALFGHGFTNDRHLVPMLVAGTMARHGFATVAINVVGHGGGPEGTLTVLRPGRDPVVLPAGGRGLDRDGDGKIGLAEGVGTLNSGPLALVSSRDGLRQTTADLMQLVRAIRGGLDVDGDGRPDLDREHIYYFGQSFGGIYGTLLMAVDPLLRAGVLNVPGGPIVEIARQAAPFRPLVIEQLKRRRPSLLNGESDFVESIPLYGQPPVRVPARGALDIQALFDRAEWLSQPANPVAFAPYLHAVPLSGMQPRPVLYQIAVGDLTVPNPTSDSLIRAGELRPVVSTYHHERVVGTLPERFKNPHGFLVWVTPAEVASIGRAAQEQVARFFLSGGRSIERTDERFELAAPAAR